MHVEHTDEDECDHVARMSQALTTSSTPLPAFGDASLLVLLHAEAKAKIEAVIETKRCFFMKGSLG